MCLNKFDEIKSHRPILPKPQAKRNDLSWKHTERNDHDEIAWENNSLVSSLLAIEDLYVM